MQSLLSELAEDNDLYFGDEPQEQAAPDAEIDRAEELLAKWQVKRGDVWEIESTHGGVHRLMCGDSTSAADVALLMDGAKAELMFTDPPYGVDYTGGHFHSGDVNIVRERPRLVNDAIDIYPLFLPLVNQFVDGACYMFFSDSKVYEVYSPSPKPVSYTHLTLPTNREV